MCFGERILVYLVISHEIFGSIVGQITTSTKRIQSRSLIFPPTTPTRLQFICGIGIPVEDLHFESVTSGYVFKAEYYLPTNATDLHRYTVQPQTIHRRSYSNDDTFKGAYSKQSRNKLHGKQNDLSTYRWTIYKAMEQLADRMGMVGRACVLKSICEVASVPFHQASGVLGEIAHIVMTPSSSSDIIRHHADNEYLHAEFLGRSGAACSHKFAECQQSLMERISTILSFSRNFFNMS